MRERRDRLVALGKVDFILTRGLGAWGGWFFVGTCFVNVLNGSEITFSKLLVNLVISIVCGLLWGIAMWRFVLARPLPEPPPPQST